MKPGVVVIAALVGVRIPVTVSTAGSSRASVWIRLGRNARSFRAAPMGKGRFRARVAFPAAGRWTLGARAGRVSRTLRTVFVDERRVRELFRAAFAQDGSLLVADGRANRILRGDPTNGITTTFAGNGGPHRGAKAVEARLGKRRVDALRKALREYRDAVDAELARDAVEQRPVSRKRPLSRRG
jgi:hypothetical protein